MVDKSLLFKAMMDDEFQQILAKDSILDVLESKKYNKSEQFFQLCTLLNESNFKICGLKTNTITPKIWCMLWILGNPFITHSREIENKDIDQFLYAVTHNIEAIQQLIESVDFCLKNNINYEDAKKQIYILIMLYFKPLTYLSKVNTVISEQPYYGVEWLTRIASQVAKTANVSALDVINNFSLNTCFYFILQDMKEKGVNGIQVQTDEDINKLIFQRTYQLANDYYNKNYKDLQP